jgi:predicted ABC-type ATPase
MAAPNLYVIAGCNGAGKTTAAFVLLPELLGCREFVNADEIARGISPFNPESVAITAGKVMLERIETLINEKVDFGFETTLSSFGALRIIEVPDYKAIGSLWYFFWLNSAETAIQRVAQRVSEGGHDIPDETIVRRYYRGIDNFKRLFQSAGDFWMIVDNSGSRFRIIAESEDALVKVHDYETYGKIMGIDGK